MCQLSCIDYWRYHAVGWVGAPRPSAAVAGSLRLLFTGHTRACRAARARGLHTKCCDGARLRSGARRRSLGVPGGRSLAHRARSGAVRAPRGSCAPRALACGAKIAGTRVRQIILRWGSPRWGVSRRVVVRAGVKRRAFPVAAQRRSFSPSDRLSESPRAPSLGREQY